MHALSKFRQYLVGSKFVVKTDHNSLKHFMRQKDLNERQQKWVSKLQAYDFDIEYVKGKNNIVADALSRRPHLQSLCELSADWKELIAADYVKNQFATSLLEGHLVDERYKLVDGIIYYKDRIFLVRESKLKNKILQSFHDVPLAGHQGIFKTYKQIRERFTWKGLKEEVLNYIRECPICQRNKNEHSYPAGLLQPLPIPNQKWESIAMDFITGLPKVQGRDCIFVVVEIF